MQRVEAMEGCPCSKMLWVCLSISSYFSTSGDTWNDEGVIKMTRALMELCSQDLYVPSPAGSTKSVLSYLGAFRFGGARPSL